MAIHTDALATIYARSLYELADQAGGTEKIFEIGSELEQICEIARADKGFREFLASPIIDTKRRSDAIGRMFRDRIADLTLRFLLVVNAKGRLSQLESFNAAYDHLVQAKHGRVEVDMYTASPLDDEQASRIAGRIQSALGKEPALHRYTDESMIGGIKLHIGDQLIDGSVATRLRRLRQNLITSGSASVRERFDRILEPGSGNGEPT